MKILLVEDNEFISFLYKRQLERADLPTDIASTGKEALELLGKNPYDFIMLDMLLPDMNGMDILKHIKKDDTVKHIPVLLLSNVGQESIIDEANQYGAVGYLIKDQYSPDELVTKVKSLIPLP